MLTRLSEIAIFSLMIIVAVVFPAATVEDLSDAGKNRVVATRQGETVFLIND